MIFIHLLFWLIILILIYILIKCREYFNAILVCIGGIFIEKFHFTQVLFNHSILRVLLSYLSWILQSNSFVMIIGVFLTLSICSTLTRMLKAWIKLGIFVTILYWIGR